ncbi:ATPase subunit 1 [Tanacetum coccineum]
MGCKEASSPFFSCFSFFHRDAELTTLLESRISNFYTNFQVDEIGRVVSVGDGIARVYGLNEIQAGEMVEFASEVAFCDNINAFSAPPSPEESPFPESTPPPLVPPEVPVPEPLLTDQVRNDILYRRYLLLNLGGDPGDLGRMVNIISSQFFIEKTIEHALLQDGWSPDSIVAHYTTIRGIIHTPQGRLLSPQTYTSYVSQINKRGIEEQNELHGDLPITEMHRGTERTSYIPFPLNPETRSDIIPSALLLFKFPKVISYQK